MMKKNLIEVWNKPLEKEIEAFLDWLLKQDIVQQQLYDTTLISGSNTTVFPITVCQNSIEVQWKLDTEPKWLLSAATGLFSDIILYAIFSKSDGSCPSKLIFQLNNPRY